MPKISHFGANLCESVREEIAGSISLVGCISGEIQDVDPGPFFITALTSCLPKETGTARLCVIWGFEDSSGDKQERVSIGQLEIESPTQTYLPPSSMVITLEKSGFLYLEAMELPFDLDIDRIEKDVQSLRKVSIINQRCLDVKIHVRDEEDLESPETL